MLEAEFLPDFQNFYTKIFRKVSPFQKYILKKYIGWLRGKKMTKNLIFSEKKNKILNFWSFSVIFGPLNPLQFFLCIFFKTTCFF